MSSLLPTPIIGRHLPLVACKEVIMDLIPIYFLFVRALTAHLDRLEALLGPEWSTFRDRLLRLMDELVAETDEQQVLLLVQQVNQLGRRSPAAELVLALYR